MEQQATRNALSRLGEHRSKLSRQQLKTLRGQILSGNIDGAMRGLDKILKQKKEVHHGIQDKNRLV